MIGIDFTWINLNGKLTQSLEIFTCDLLDCIAQKKKSAGQFCYYHASRNGKFAAGTFSNVSGIWNGRLWIEVAPFNNKESGS